MDYENTILYYIEIFATGAIRKIETDSRTWTIQENSKYFEKKDIEYFCNKFLKEHFIHVQKEFWKRYKNEYKIYQNRYSYLPQPITAKEIFKTCQNLKMKKKKSKKN